MKESRPPTAIARALRISRQSLWRIHRRNPGLKQWAHQQFREGNQHLIGPVVRMLGATALRTKSPKHAELFLKAVGTLDARDDGDGASAPGVAAFQMNFLIPRPEMPALAAPPVPRLPPPDQIPQVEGRRSQPTRHSLTPPDQIPVVDVRK